MQIKPSRREASALLALLLLCVMPLHLSADSLTMTTWYPAPYGVYTNLRSTQDAYFAYKSGNVGIGTTSPGEKLAVSGTAGTNIRQIIGDSQTHTSLYAGYDTQTWSILEIVRNSATSRNGTAGLVLTSNQANPDLTIDGAGSISFVNRAVAGSTDLRLSIIEGGYDAVNSGNLRFWTSTNGNVPTEKMRITSSGNVGIGTTGPEALLHLGGNTPKLKFGPTGAVTDGWMQLSYSGTNNTTNDGITWQLDSNVQYASVKLNIEDGVNRLGNILFATSPGGPSYLPVERMRISSNGSVGIGTTSPGAKLQVGSSGDGTAALANAWNTFSSRRCKENIHSIGGALDKIGRLRGVEFEWKGSGKRDMGVVAEEVGKVFPEIVDYETNGQDARGLDYSKLIAPLIEAVKAQQEEIKDQQQQIQTLRKQNEDQKTMVAAFKKELAGMRPK